MLESLLQTPEPQKSAPREAVPGPEEKSEAAEAKLSGLMEEKLVPKEEESAPAPDVRKELSDADRKLNDILGKGGK